MRKEYKLQFEALFRILWVVVFALFYALGGIQFKWIRRFVAPVWLGGGLYLFSRDWWKVFQIVFIECQQWKQFIRFLQISQVIISVFKR